MHFVFIDGYFTNMTYFYYNYGDMILLQIHVFSSQCVLYYSATFIIIISILVTL